MDAIELMMYEHKYIKRTLAVIRKISIGVLNGNEVPFEDFKRIIEFVRNYADKHHHNKEEEILFKKMREDIGETLAGAPISGMLVEHDFGRLFIKNLDEALQRVKNGDLDSRVDVIANAIGYADLLNRHIDKEDKVIYTFARRSLKEDAMNYVNESCKKVEDAAESENLQKKYITMVEELESKWQI
ncbi:hemerythrin domain-containing protein [Clostridium thermarum]|uniref:hemerythrin domain-containing protein n=1 Tax=Clostridium thermarum TaxID=1716543 RepID=UPI0013D382F1|nr:hemerythrin domain-containing protein [Clostridium thermarum]